MERSADDKFRYAIDRVLAHEGGYVNDPDDPGGETKYGISKRSYPKADIRNLTREHAEGIYYRDFWIGPRIDCIADTRVAAKMLDLAVNMGPHRAVKLLQAAANSLGCELVEDGELGAKTLAAVNGIAHKPALLCSILIEAGLYYRSLRKPRYLAGWLNRLIDL